MDSTRGSLAGGRKFRMLNMMDGYAREAPRIEVDTSPPGCYGPEFISRAVGQWAYAHGVALHFIESGRPLHNAFIESPDKSGFRDEHLN